MDDQLGQQIVEARMRRIASIAAAVDADPRPTRRLIDRQPPALRPHLAGGVKGLEVDPKLHRRAAGRRRRGEPKIGQAPPLGDPDLQGDEIKPRHRLGHRVLDLQTGVDLDEPGRDGRGRIDQELDRGEPLQLRRLGERQSLRVQRPAKVRGQPDGRCELDQLLPTALKAALPVPQHLGAPTVADHLHLDMPRFRHRAFEIDAVIAERRLRLRATLNERRLQRVRIGHRAHPSPAPARRRLHQHPRRALLRHEPACGGEVRRVDKTRQTGDPGCAREPDGPDFVAEQLQRQRRRPDEDEAGVATRASKRRLLAQKAVTWMHRLGAEGSGCGDDRIDVEIGAHPAARQDGGFIAETRVQTVRVIARMDAQGHATEVGQRPRDPDGDLAAISDQHALKSHG